MPSLGGCSPGAPLHSSPAFPPPHTGGHYRGLERLRGRPSPRTGYIEITPHGAPFCSSPSAGLLGGSSCSAVPLPALPPPPRRLPTQPHSQALPGGPLHPATVSGPFPSSSRSSALLPFVSWNTLSLLCLTGLAPALLSIPLAPGHPRVMPQELGPHRALLTALSTTGLPREPTHHSGNYPCSTWAQVLLVSFLLLCRPAGPVAIKPQTVLHYDHHQTPWPGVLAHSRCSLNTCQLIDENQNQSGSRTQWLKVTLKGV